MRFKPINRLICFIRTLIPWCDIGDDVLVEREGLGDGERPSRFEPAPNHWPGGGRRGGGKAERVDELEAAHLIGENNNKNDIFLNFIRKIQATHLIGEKLYNKNNIFEMLCQSTQQIDRKIIFLIKFFSHLHTYVHFVDGSVEHW